MSQPANLEYRRGAQKLTDHLVSLSTARPYSAAIEHPFLISAGNGTLPESQLSLYLSQDRIYASHAYPRFIGLLISRIPFSPSHSLESLPQRRNQRILKILSFSLANVVREVEFFGETARKWGLDLGCWNERKGTRDYTAEMARITALGSLEEGLVFLWAMERVYLDAWTNVRSLLDKQSVSPPSSAPAVSALASNWSSSEFVKFVDELADIVNDLDIEPGSSSWEKAENVWARVVELEEGFWPENGEEVTMQKKLA